jgi:tetratricopeptide (TPR) repeat protein
MPNEKQFDPRNHFVPRYLPWLLGGAMLVVYVLTLNPWVTLQNIFQVALVSDWSWQPRIVHPLIYLVTLPLRLAPAAHLPWLLNLFSAACAAATLGVLARSVAILPHDRTEMERTHERSDFSFLTGWVAWLPPVTAVFFAGLQLGFWKHATSFTGESFQLLWFAVMLWQWLEYRLDEAEWRLYLTAFMFGAGLSDNWALAGYIPLFLMVIIWLRKLEFFRLDFLGRMTVSGLAGLLFFLLLPLKAKLTSIYPVTFWDMLRPNLGLDWMVIKLVHEGTARKDIALMALTSLLPAFVMSIRWSSSFGDSSRLGAALVNYVMHAVGLVLFGTLTWAAFDPPFSAARLVQELAPGTPALTLYYIGALGLGYYLGYALLIFGRPPVPSRRNPHPDPALPEPIAWLCPIIVAATLAGTAMAAGLLLYKNAPLIHAINGDALLKYAQLSTRSLPREGAVLLCDSDDPSQDTPNRAFLIHAMLVREGRAQKFPVVDTMALRFSPYHDFLHQQYPKIWPELGASNQVVGVPQLRNLLILSNLSKSNELCYLNPSFGCFFEKFYLEPHGLIYTLKAYPENTVLGPALDQSVLAENESFWSGALEQTRPAIVQALHPPEYRRLPQVLRWFMLHLHVMPEPDPNALMAATIYSRGLNYLGVQVQRAGDLAQAATLFKSAVELNSNNVAASVNLDFNKTLSAGQPTPVSSTAVTADRFGNYHNWTEVLAADGPFDESSFCFDNAAFFMQADPPLTHQAAALFERVRQLAPDNLPTRFFLAQIYIAFHQPEGALEVLKAPLTEPSRFALTGYDEASTELDVLAAGAYLEKGDNAPGVALLEKEMDRHPDNETLLMMSAQSFNMHHLYADSLRVINRKLARSPDDPTWIFGKGLVSLQLSNYNDAVAALSRFLQVETNNPNALFNRGVAYLQSGHLDAARADLLQFQTGYANNLEAAYHLGEIAWRQHHTNEIIRNYQILVANAPTNVPEMKTVRERLLAVQPAGAR